MNLLSAACTIIRSGVFRNSYHWARGSSRVLSDSCGRLVLLGHSNARLNSFALIHCLTLFLPTTLSSFPSVVHTAWFDSKNEKLEPHKCFISVSTVWPRCSVFPLCGHAVQCFHCVATLFSVSTLWQRCSVFPRCGHAVQCFHCVATLHCFIHIHQ